MKMGPRSQGRPQVAVDNSVNLWTVVGPNNRRQRWKKTRLERHLPMHSGSPEVGRRGPDGLLPASGFDGRICAAVARADIPGRLRTRRIRNYSAGCCRATSLTWAGTVRWPRPGCSPIGPPWSVRTSLRTASRSPFGRVNCGSLPNRRPGRRSYAYSRAPSWPDWWLNSGQMSSASWWWPVQLRRPGSMAVTRCVEPVVPETPTADRGVLIAG